eukprot:TRINITY_DN6379_c0_g1_i1.p1 TRINITY_DN6379_c0_g1~~TRINITY_DN6379_c0_g1_i1.p1  ORF type:complete len:200 (+),score=21.63 TRINITY_DN6379_c0_g1_i1:477-1076(+)
MMETFTRINSGILRGLSVVNGDSKLTMCMLPESPKTAVQNGSHSSERFKEMFEETKALIELKSFDTAITSCSDIAYTYGKEEFRSICAASVGEGLQNGCVDSHKIPFPKMIPLMYVHIQIFPTLKSQMVWKIKSKGTFLTELQVVQIYKTFRKLFSSLCRKQALHHRLSKNATVDVIWLILCCEEIHGSAWFVCNVQVC